jgi:hypothetical protein
LRTVTNPFSRQITGFDLTTGLGSPKAYTFVHGLANALA